MKKVARSDKCTKVNTILQLLTQSHKEPKFTL